MSHNNKIIVQTLPKPQRPDKALEDAKRSELIRLMNQQITPGDVKHLTKDEIAQVLLEIL